MAPLSPLPSTSVASTLMIGQEKKRVQFKGKVLVREIQRLAENDAEKGTYWYTKQQYDTMRVRNHRLIGMMNSNQHINEEHELDCTRGLEYRTREATYNRRSIRDAAISSVLEEQQFQQEHNFQDPDTISLIYYELSKRPSRDARIMGLNDERYIREKVINLIEQNTDAEEQTEIVVSNDVNANTNIKKMPTTLPCTQTSLSYGKTIVRQNGNVTMPDNSDHQRRLRRFAGAAAA